MTNHDGSRVVMHYDPLGRRIGKSHYDAHGVLLGQTDFTWDGLRLLSETRNGRHSLYLYDEGSYDPLARVDGQGEHARLRYYHTDPNGLPQQLTEDDGRCIWQARYQVWGNTLVETQESFFVEEQNLRFQGQYLDRETGLHYNTFRFYDPDIGRFISPDPIGLAGGINLYQYAENPIGWVDPWGLKRCSPTTGKNYNPSSWARQWQGRGIYKGRDAWKNTTLKKGDIIYGGAPGQSGFYFNKATLTAAGGSRASLWKSLQVLPHAKFGYRGKVQAYRVKRDVIVGTGQAKAQDPSVFGAGGGTQIFMSNYKTILEPVGKPFDLGI